MLAIADYLKSQGYAPSSAEHMRIPGIWKKLGTLYNLEALDERVGHTRALDQSSISLLIPAMNQEDAVFADTNEDEEEEPSEMYWPFELPYDEYGDLMFERRLATEGSLSPVTSRHAESRRGSTVADTDGKLQTSPLNHLPIPATDPIARRRASLISRSISRPQIQSWHTPTRTRNSLDTTSN